MSAKGRSTHSQPPSSSSRQAQSSTIPTVTIPPRISASGPDNALRDRLLDDYNFAFDQGNQLTSHLSAVHDPSMTARYLSGMVLALDNIVQIGLLFVENQLRHHPPYTRKTTSYLSQFWIVSHHFRNISHLPFELFYVKALVFICAVVFLLSVVIIVSQRHLAISLSNLCHFSFIKESF